MPIAIKNFNMTYKEVVAAMKAGIPLIWNDPDPIKGNDYTIASVEEIIDGEDDFSPILIQYGSGSEAEVFLHEISIKPINENPL